MSKETAEFVLKKKYEKQNLCFIILNFNTVDFIRVYINGQFNVV